MDNQPPLITPTQTPTSPVQPVQSPPTPGSPVNGSTPPTQEMNKPAGRKKTTILLSVLLVLILMGAAAAYGLLVYIPNKPENILKKAALNFVEQGGNYTLSGRMDHGDGNAPDFTYTIKTDGRNTLAVVDSSTFVMGPNVEILQVDGKRYVKFDEWMDSAKLAQHYTNHGPKGIQEDLAAFAENSGLYSKQGEWIQIDDFIFESPTAGSGGAVQSMEEFGLSIVSIDASETKDGKKLQNYTVALTKDGVRRLLDTVTDGAIAKNMFDAYAAKNGFPDSIAMKIQVDKETKTIYTLEYQGRPFRDAEFSLSMMVGDNSFSPPDEAPLASQVLDYGVVRSFLFNPDFQAADSAGDRERIADIKGIKMLLEIYKRKHGSYPTRSYPVTGQEDMLKEMKGIDQDILVDPNGKFLGWHGSQYTYIGETAEGSEMCGSKFYDIETGGDIDTPDCAKFWVMTTLDDGQEFKLTSY